jgi:hypothetical protein
MGLDVTWLVRREEESPVIGRKITRHNAGSSGWGSSWDESNEMRGEIVGMRGGSLRESVSGLSNRRPSIGEPNSAQSGHSHRPTWLFLFPIWKYTFPDPTPEFQPVLGHVRNLSNANLGPEYPDHRRRLDPIARHNLVPTPPHNIWAVPPHG